jgi:ABC-type branched-subunit amino acid transport system substrate-binding protein
MKTFITLLALIGLFVFLCFSPYNRVEDVRNIRQQKSLSALTPFDVALVWPGGDDGLFFEGAMMAVSNINNRGGIIIKNERGELKQIELRAHIFDELIEPDNIARKIASNSDILAVVGYSDPDLAIRASVTFLDSRIMFIAPAVSDLQLTLHGFRNVIQTTPNDEQISRAMVEFALKQGWLKAGLLNVRNSYGLTYAKLIKENAEKYFVKGPGTNGTNSLSNLSLTFQGRYAEEDRQFYTLIASLLETEFDLVIIADSLIGASRERTLAMIDQLRQMGVVKPILGTEELHFTTLTDELKEKSGAIFAASPVDLTKTVDRANASAFSLGDFFELESVVHRLKQAERPIDVRINDQLSLAVKSEIDKNSRQNDDSDSLRQSLIESFNKIVNEPSFFTEALFQELKLSLETKALLARDGASENSMLLNRLLLEDAYRQESLRNNVPYETKRFKLGFEAMFGKAARVQAAQAYEAMYLLAQAVYLCRSKMPVKVAAMFASTDSWDGLEGEEAYQFRLDGSIKGKHVAVHELRGSDFHDPKFSHFHDPKFKEEIPEIVFKNLYENLDSDQEER